MPRIWFDVFVNCPYCGVENKIRVDDTSQWVRPQVILCDCENVPGCDRYFVVDISQPTAEVKTSSILENASGPLSEISWEPSTAGA